MGIPSLRRLRHAVDHWLRHRKQPAPKREVHVHLTADSEALRNGLADATARLRRAQRCTEPTQY